MHYEPVAGMECEELLDALEESLSYVSEYFVEKHDMLAPLRKHGRSLASLEGSQG
jgi:hypothetical protein